MDATARVLQRPCPLSRHPKRGQQHSPRIILRRLVRMNGRRGSSPIGGATLAKGIPRFCERVPARQAGEVVGIAMCEGSRREGEKLGTQTPT
jgi:hypothetical protein